MEVTQYRGIYGLAGASSSDCFTTFVTNIDNRVFTARNLIPRTRYTIRVEASHMDIFEFIGPPAAVTGETEVLQGMQFVYS